MPDFDAGALETLLTLAVAQNNRDLWVILPKEAGSIEPVRLATYPDQEGTLDGKPSRRTTWWRRLQERIRSCFPGRRTNCYRLNCRRVDLC